MRTSTRFSGAAGAVLLAFAALGFPAAQGGTADIVLLNGNVITVQLEQGSDATGIREIIEDLYTFYREHEAAARQ